MGLSEDRYVGLSTVLGKVILHKTDLGLYLKGGPKYQKRLLFLMRQLSDLDSESSPSVKALQ